MDKIVKVDFNKFPKNIFPSASIFEGCRLGELSEKLYDWIKNKGGKIDKQGVYFMNNYYIYLKIMILSNKKLLFSNKRPLIGRVLPSNKIPDILSIIPNNYIVLKVNKVKTIDYCILYDDNEIEITYTIELKSNKHNFKNLKGYNYNDISPDILWHLQNISK